MASTAPKTESGLSFARVSCTLFVTRPVSHSLAYTPGLCGFVVRVAQTI